MPRDSIIYPPEWDPSWPGKVLRCTVCKRRFFATGSVKSVEQERKEGAICDTCYNEAVILEGVPDAVHQAVDGADPDYYAAGDTDFSDSIDAERADEMMA